MPQLSPYDIIPVALPEGHGLRGKNITSEKFRRAFVDDVSEKTLSEIVVNLRESKNVHKNIEKALKRVGFTMLSEGELDDFSYGEIIRMLKFLKNRSKKFDRAIVSLIRREFGVNADRIAYILPAVSTLHDTYFNKKFCDNYLIVGVRYESGHLRNFVLEYKWVDGNPLFKGYDLLVVPYATINRGIDVPTKVIVREGRAVVVNTSTGEVSPFAIEVTPELRVLVKLGDKILNKRLIGDDVKLANVEFQSGRILPVVYSGNVGIIVALNTLKKPGKSIKFFKNLVLAVQKGKIPVVEWVLTVNYDLSWRNSLVRVSGEPQIYEPGMVMPVPFEATKVRIYDDVRPGLEFDGKADDIFVNLAIHGDKVYIYDAGDKKILRMSAIRKAMKNRKLIETPEAFRKIFGTGTFVYKKFNTAGIVTVRGEKELEFFKSLCDVCYTMVPDFVADTVKETAINTPVSMEFDVLPGTATELGRYLTKLKLKPLVSVIEDGKLYVYFLKGKRVYYISASAKRTLPSDLRERLKWSQSAGDTLIAPGINVDKMNKHLREIYSAVSRKGLKPYIVMSFDGDGDVVVRKVNDVVYIAMHVGSHHIITPEFYEVLKKLVEEVIEGKVDKAVLHGRTVTEVRHFDCDEFEKLYGFIPTECYTEDETDVTIEYDFLVPDWAEPKWLADTYVEYKREQAVKRIEDGTYVEIYQEKGEL